MDTLHTNENEPVTKGYIIQKCHYYMEEIPDNDVIPMHFW